MIFLPHFLCYIDPPSMAKKRSRKKTYEEWCLVVFAG